MRIDVRAVVLAGAVLAGGGGVAWMLRDPPTAPDPAPVEGATAAEVDRPNVLIVLWDTVRADRMSLYGHDRPTTPRLDARAAQGRVYEQAISPGMWTVPAHGSLFTGLSAASHGAKVGWLWLDGHHVTLAEHLSDHGYDTFAWSSNPYLSSATNLLQGFDTVETSWTGRWADDAAEATEAKLIDADRSSEISPAFEPGPHQQGWPEHLTAYKDGAVVAGEALTTWLDERDDDGPWLAYLNWLEAHHPRVPSLRAREAVLEPELLERGLQTDATLFRTMSAMENRAEFSDAELQAMAGVYDATLVDLDRATDALLDALQARGALDDTIVVLVSDHGEHLGEHGMHDHRWSLAQELVHVPLVVWGPGIEPGRVSTPTSTGDLFGSVLAWTGLPAPDVAHDLPELGHQPRAFTELVAPTPRLPEIVSAYPRLVPNRWGLRYQAVLEDGWKLVRVSSGKHRLFHLAEDPREQDDVITAHQDHGKELWQKVVAWDEARPPYDPSRRAPSDQPGRPLDEDPGMAEQLRLLGYTEGDDEEETP